MVWSAAGAKICQLRLARRRCSPVLSKNISYSHTSFANRARNKQADRQFGIIFYHQRIFLLSNLAKSVAMVGKVLAATFMGQVFDEAKLEAAGGVVALQALQVEQLAQVIRVASVESF